MGGISPSLIPQILGMMLGMMFGTIVLIYHIIHHMSTLYPCYLISSFWNQNTLDPKVSSYERFSGGTQEKWRLAPMWLPRNSTSQMRRPWGVARSFSSFLVWREKVLWREMACQWWIVFFLLRIHSCFIINLIHQSIPFWLKWWEENGTFTYFYPLAILNGEHLPGHKLFQIDLREVVEVFFK